MLLDPAQAFLARPEYVIRQDALLEPALDQVMRNVEFWLNRDPELLRNQLLIQTSNARADILTSDAGIQAMQQLAAKRFAQPVIVRKIVEHSGRKASSTEKTLSEIAGMILSGRPSQARDIPAGSFAEVEADYGLLPAPLEKNSRAKGYFSLLRHRENSGGWLNPTGQPSEPVLARCIRELIQKHPDASRLVLQFTVLRRMGQPVEWRYTVEPSATGIRIHANGKAPGFEENTTANLSSAQLADQASIAP